MSQETHAIEDVVGLRHAMVDALVATGAVTDPRVEAAMRAVPRERFLPGVAPAEAFQLDDGVVTKRDENGVAVSSVSAPHLQAYMLEQTLPERGMRVLEVGSGGYNAALLAEMVGPDGRVTSLDIDPFVTERASRFLAETGYDDRVEVVLADANEPLPADVQFDRILVTVGAWDVAPSWFDALVDGGFIVIPLQVLGLSNTTTFVKRDGLLESTASMAFGFVPMRGAGEHEATLLVLRDGEVTLRFDDDPPQDLEGAARALTGVFDAARVEVDTQAPLRPSEPWAGAQMWLASGLPGSCRVVIDREKDSGLISPPGRHLAALGVLDGPNLAYATTRPSASEDLHWWAHAYGPDAESLATRIANRMQAWAAGPRASDAEPRFTIAPAGTPDKQLPAGSVVDKPHSRVVISWPEPGQASNTAR